MLNSMALIVCVQMWNSRGNVGTDYRVPTSLVAVLNSRSVNVCDCPDSIFHEMTFDLHIWHGYLSGPYLGHSRSSFKFLG